MNKGYNDIGAEQIARTDSHSGCMPLRASSSCRRSAPHWVGETMKRIVTLAVSSILLLSFMAMAQTPHVAEKAPPDQPFASNANEIDRLQEAIKPYIEKARKSYPQAKERFQAGLPARHSFFVTTRLRDDTGRFEQVFIAVQRIEGANISGRIWSNVYGVKGYKYGDRYTFQESEIIDWLIARPDGTEEGNFVGNFLDEYQKTIETTQRGGAPDRQESTPASR